MANSFVQVPTDSTGKKLQTFNNTVGTDSVHSEGVTVVRSSDNTEVGTSSQPLRTDPTGTTTQPVSDAGGSLTVDNGGTFAVQVTSAPSTAVTNAGTFAVQEADGANTTLGAKADAKSTATDTTSVSAMSVLKQISASVQAPPSQAVTNAGTFATQAAQSGTWTVQPGNTANTTAWKVDGSAVTQPVSAASLPLPSGAATAAKQPALGTAGSASADVITVQGNASGTPIPVSGSFSASFGTATSGGTSTYHAVSAASNNAANVKSSAGQVYGGNVFNNAGYTVYVKLYNKATTPAPATDNALLKQVIGVTAGTFAQIPSPAVGIAYSSGISIAIVKNISDTDNTSVAASDCTVDLLYA